MPNSLLASLPFNDFSVLQPHLRQAELVAGQYLQTSGRDIEQVYFPESGLISILTGTDKHAIEIAMVGREGMIGAPTLLGDHPSSHSALVQVSGPAWMIAAQDLRQVAGVGPELRQRLLGFVSALMTQVEQATVSMARFTVLQRLARWLLMANDRLDGDELAITHDRLASALGVRRPGVTIALHILEGKTAIRSNRGRVTIRDRERLKRLAGPAYLEPSRGPVSVPDGGYAASNPGYHRSTDSRTMNGHPQSRTAPSFADPETA